MPDALLLNLSALIALLPASLAAQRKIATRDTVFWLVLGVAVGGRRHESLGRMEDMEKVFPKERQI